MKSERTDGEWRFLFLWLLPAPPLWEQQRTKCLRNENTIPFIFPILLDPLAFTFRVANEEEEEEEMAARTMQHNALKVIVMLIMRFIREYFRPAIWSTNTVECEGAMKTRAAVIVS